MSLPVLVAIVVFGIALSVAAVHFTGGSRQAELAGGDQALRRFAEDFPDETMGKVRLTADGRTAFLDLGNERVGIVHGVGDCFLTRIVTRHDVVTLEAAEANTIALRLADFTWRGGRFVLAASADVDAIASALAPAPRDHAGEAV